MTLPPLPSNFLICKMEIKNTTCPEELVLGALHKLTCVLELCPAHMLKC